MFQIAGGREKKPKILDHIMLSSVAYVDLPNPLGNWVVCYTMHFLELSIKDLFQNWLGIIRIFPFPYFQYK
jgi:hypothetical protein